MNNYPKNQLATAIKSALFGLALLPVASLAQDKEDVAQLDDYVVEDVNDDFSVLPTEPSEGAFGFSKPLLETPRSVSEVTAELAKNYGLRSVDDLVRMTPGAFTSSFFGIQGAMDLRGEPADNFFRGFRRIENPGAFKTNIRGASKLEILRGPVSPLYGTGSVGGQLNYIPKSAKSDTAKYIESATGRVDVTVGSYDQKIISAEGGMPFSLAGRQGGIYAFAEYEKSDSFYDIYSPTSKMVQVAVDYDVSDSTVMEFGFQWQSSDHIQVPGWNRVTQDLIDHGIYITGAPPVRNSDNPIGADRLLPQESGFILDGVTNGAPNASFSSVNTWCIPGDGAEFSYNGMPLTCFGPAYALQEDTVGTAKIDHETIFIDTIDYADSDVLTLYLDFITEFDNGMTWKNQFFMDYMDHEKFQSWGFTADYPDAKVYELRSSLTFEYELGGASTENIVGFSVRKDDLDLNHAWYDETFDTRDLTVGPTPDDRFDWAVSDPYLEDGTLRRNFNEEQVSENINSGVFFLSDITMGQFSLLVGARYDYYDIEAYEEARDLLGALIVDADGDNKADVKSDTDSTVSYNISLSYNSDFGLVPYVTYAESNSLSTNQLGGVIAATVDNGEWLQESELFEAGLKYSGFDGRLYTAVAYFDQEKTYRDGQTAALVAVYSDGVEFEARAVVTDNWSVTATATHIDTTEVSDGALAVLNGADFAIQNGMEPWEVYGGRFAGSRSTFLGTGAEVDRGGLPDNTASLYANYVQELGDGRVTGSLGFSWVDSTYTDIFKTVELPSYSVWTSSVGYITDSYELLLSVNNLLDEDYYTSADLFDSVVVKPSEGRTFSATFGYKF
ncbi:TonB-dependent receptor [Neiella marina]|uniref:TonB-dependent receptor n=1 Tax=Neiella marina TaxID=508461 RepID=A0A8J2XNM1_9GAMM|nr:TonB-dependent receptor plug domain-containing protein [Neiella marina]GGA73081.1 TonB-dependent receptor [Neiella marina]